MTVFGRTCTSLLVCLAAMPVMASAQESAPDTSEPAARSREGRERRPAPVTIENANILSMSDDGTFRGTVVLRRGKIAQVQKRSGISIGLGGGPRRGVIDGSGKFVTPGFIDASSSLALSADGGAGGRASFKAADAVDPFDRAVFEEVLRQGVTTICVEPPHDSGFVGSAAVIRLENLDDLGTTTRDDVCLVARVGRGAKGPVARLNELSALRKALEDAKTYREAQEAYEEELEEYRKGLKEGKTVKLEKKEAKKSPESGPAPAPDEQQRRRRGRRPPRPRPPRMSAVDQVNAWLGESAWQESPPEPREWYTGFTGPICDEGESEEAHALHSGGHDYSAEEQAAEWEALLDMIHGQADGEKQDGKSDAKGELTKPQKPDPSTENEVLVRALKHEIPVRFEVHHPADVAAVLKLIEEFNLKASVSGVAGAGFVADEIGETGMQVLIDRSWAAAGLDRTHWGDVAASNAKLLAAAGAPIVITSGRMPGVSTAYLSQLAAMWAGGGLDRDAAMKGITIEAARACGMDGEIGSIEKDKLADVVVWSNHPLRPDAVVERVFVGGREVYRRPGIGG